MLCQLVPLCSFEPHTVRWLGGPKNWVKSWLCVLDCALYSCVSQHFLKKTSSGKVGRQVSPFLQATKVLRESRGIALLCLLDLGTRRVWGVSVTPRPLYTPGKDPVPIVQEAGWAPEPVWTCAENLAPTGIRSPDSPARSQSLYRLSYPANIRKCKVLK
jgi:hypothetical protein